MAKYIDISIIEDWLKEQANIERQGADPFSAGACIAYEKARMFLETMNTRTIRQVLKEWSESPDGRASYEKVADEMRAKMNEPQGLDEAAEEYSDLLPTGRISKKYSTIDFKAGAEWSEEDEKMLMGIIERGSSQIPSYEPALRGGQIEWLMNRLKFLHPQLSDEDIKKIRSEEYTKGFNDAACGGKTWKPSDEQMKALQTIYEFLSTSSSENVKLSDKLRSLYNDLKKL